MANIFDRFDGMPVAQPAPAQTTQAPQAGNVFDQFDAAPVAAPSASPLTNAMLPLRDDQGNINIMPEIHREMGNLRGLQEQFTPDNWIGDVMDTANAPVNWLLEAMLGGANAQAKGIRDMGVGLARAPLDLMSAVGAPGAAEGAQAIGDAVPQVNTDSTAQNVGAAITQYALPAGVGASLATKALPAAASPVVKFITSLFGAGAGDALATDPDNASTIGNLAPTIAPTAIEADDDPMEKRLKVGAESVPVGAAVSGLFKGGSKLLQELAPIFMRFTPEGRRFMVGQQLADAGVPENVAKEAQNVAGGPGDFKPVVSDVVNTPEAQGLARQVINAPEGSGLVNAVKENERAISTNFNEALAPAKASKNATGLPEGAAASEFARQGEARLNPATRAVENIENAQGNVAAQTATNQAQITAQAGTRQDASATLSDLIEQELQNATDVKNGLYAQAKELGQGVNVDPQQLADIAGAVRSDIGPLAQQDQSLNSILGDLDRLAPEGEAVPTGLLGPDGTPLTRAPEAQAVTLGDLIDLRPRLSRAIDQATGKYRGDVVEHLTELRRQIDQQINALAEGEGPAVEALRAAEANFRNSFAPKFREGQGGVIDKAAKTGNPVQPTATADVFLKSNNAKGAREAVEDLNRIFAESEGRPAAQGAARNYMVGLMADKLGNNVTGPRVEQFIATYGEAIDGIPGLRRELQQMANRLNAGSSQTAALDEGLKAAQEARKGVQGAINESPAGLWVNGKVDQVINEAMTNPQKMAQLVSQARRDPSGAALADVKNQIKAKINDMIRNDGSQTAGGVKQAGSNTGKALENKDVVVSLAKANDLLKEGTKQREALKRIFSPAEMKNLDLYRKQLELSTRITSMRGLKNSDTTLNMIAGVQSGAGVLSGDIRAGMVARFVKFLDKTIGNTSEKRLRLLTDALTDPELAGTLVMEYNEANAKVIERKLSTYITNNVLSVDTPEGQKKAPPKSP